MSNRYRRNIGKHTDTAQVEANILADLRKHGVTRERGVPMSALGYAGFPGYSFRWPQGAALAVSRIVRSMIQRGVLLDGPRGYYPK